MSRRFSNDLIRSGKYETEKLASNVFSSIIHAPTSRHIKRASVSPLHSDYAEAYALYKAAALCHFPEEQINDGVRVAVLSTLDTASF